MTEDATNNNSSNDLPIAEWHERLGEHFTALASQRAADGWPVFALEHGLAGEEIARLEEAVHRELRVTGPSLRSYLPWIVYAAEFGYKYSGSEYWQSFGAATPRWEDRWRTFIREAFERFARKYGGAQPEGAWAGNFTIICWPITHGVLPRDLQYQLAKVLYYARFSLRPELFETAQALGAHLRERSLSASARFAEFAENELLLGQIAAALLVDEPQTELLSADTLHRIVTDINRERASAEWLSEARRATKNWSVRGLSSRKASGNAAPSSRSATVRALAEAWADDGAAGRARLLLRPRGQGEWDAIVEIPDLAPLANQSPQYRPLLENLRARIAGARAKVLAKGRLIGCGPQRVTLEEWPKPNTPLIDLEGAPPNLQMLLHSTFCSPAGSSLLFRVAVDGIAYLKSEPTVRPGETYLLTVPTPVEHPAGGIRNVQLTCEGVFALYFTVPDVVDDLWRILLERLHLRASQTLEVWPVGLWPAEWDGIGDATWLERDEVILGIRTNQSVDRIVLSLSGQAVSLDYSTSQAMTRFVSLGRMPVGRYPITIHAESSAGESQPSGKLQVSIRSELSVPAGRSDRQAMALSTYPAAPALEDIWEGRLQLQLRGPAGQRVRPRVAFVAGKPAKEVYQKRMAELSLPVEPEAWDSAFNHQVRSDRSVEELIDTASRVLVEFDGGPLGHAKIEAEREFTPLRWALRKSNGRQMPVLIDDAGSSSVKVEFRAAGHPSQRTALDYETATRGAPIEYPGGLLVASDGTRHAAAVFVPREVLRTLDQLAVRPVLENASPDLPTIVRQAAEWQDAREKGSVMAATVRRAVVDVMLAEISGSVGGQVWRRAEYEWLAGKTLEAQARMKLSLADNADERIIGAMIAQSSAGWATVSPLQRVDALAAALQKYAHCLRSTGVSHIGSNSNAGRESPMLHTRRLTECALRLASSPSAMFEKFTVDEVRDYLRRLREKPIVMRAARLTAVSVHLACEASVEGREILCGWKW